MRYGSVCSGIEAATAAWHPLGWEPAFFSEIEAFPSAVLKHHYPDVPLHGDFTTIGQHQYGRIDLLVGGTPCQSFSVAGLRGGLDDDRGNLALEFCRLAQREQPRWIVWENVPGVLSSGGGRDFGSILGALEDLGYGLAYRVLDAQFFGVPQRRRRVFVVGYFGDWRPPAAVLFERHSLSGNLAPSRETGQTNTASLRTRAPGSGGQGTDCEHVVAHTRAARAGSALCAPDIQTYLPWPTLCAPTLDKTSQHAVAYTLEARSEVQAVAFQSSQSGVRLVDTHATLDANNGSRRGNGIVTTSAVRRLTPVECERLQGFPDGFTDIPWRKKPAGDCPDGPRYKALGNSMAVPVMHWIGKRIQLVDDLLSLL